MTAADVRAIFWKSQLCMCASMALGMYQHLLWLFLWGAFWFLALIVSAVRHTIVMDRLHRAHAEEMRRLFEEDRELVGAMLRMDGAK